MEYAEVASSWTTLYNEGDAEFDEERDKVLAEHVNLLAERDTAIYAELGENPGTFLAPPGYPTVYVRPDAGDDANSGEGPGRAKATVEAAVATLPTITGSGRTLHYGLVELGGGSIDVYQPIEFNEGLYIRGRGSSMFNNTTGVGTTLRLVDGADCEIFAPSQEFVDNGGFNHAVKVADLTLHGNRDGQTDATKALMRVRHGGLGFELHNVGFTQAKGAGLYFSNGATNAYIQNFKATRCDGPAIHIVCDKSFTQITVNHWQLDNCGATDGDAILIEHGNNNTGAWAQVHLRDGKSEADLAAGSGVGASALHAIGIRPKTDITAGTGHPIIVNVDGLVCNRYNGASTEGAIYHYNDLGIAAVVKARNVQAVTGYPYAAECAKRSLRTFGPTIYGELEFQSSATSAKHPFRQVNKTLFFRGTGAPGSTVTGQIPSGYTGVYHREDAGTTNPPLYVITDTGTVRSVNVTTV